MFGFRAGIFQMKVSENKDENIEKAVKAVTEANKRGCSLLVLPEMFNCPYDNKFFPGFSETEESSMTLNAMKKAAAENEIIIVAGSIPERDGEKIYNTSYTISEKGEIINKHRKVHLFDVDIKDKIHFVESETLTAGDTINTFDTRFCKMGVGICYDIRFPELFLKMSMQGAKVLILPGAFNTVTGPAHWRLLGRSRAIDNQAYIIMASPALDRDCTYHAYGHSLVCDPWGRVICEAGHNEEFIDTEINLDYLELIRDEMPTMKHKRRELY